MSQNPVTGREESVAAPTLARGGARKATASYEYDFAKDGSVIATVFLRGPTLPDNVVITNCYIDVITAPLSGGAATIALGFESTTDIQTATAYNGAPYSSIGLADLAGPEPGTESGYIKLTATRGLRMTTATAVLTAGRFFVVVEFDTTD